jgi:hypothetical protein
MSPPNTWVKDKNFMLNMLDKDRSFAKYLIDKKNEEERIADTRELHFAHPPSRRIQSERSQRNFNITGNSATFSFAGGRASMTAKFRGDSCK